jgi:hypothetical protein
MIKIRNFDFENGSTAKESKQLLIFVLVKTLDVLENAMLFVSQQDEGISTIKNFTIRYL